MLVLVATAAVLAPKFFISFSVDGLFVYYSHSSLLWLCALVKNAKGAAFLQSSSIWVQSFVLWGFGQSGAWLRSSLRPEFCHLRPGIIFSKLIFVSRSWSVAALSEFLPRRQGSFSSAQINFSALNSLATVRSVVLDPRFLPVCCWSL
jgi:hypothetical protein